MESVVEANTVIGKTVEKPSDVSEFQDYDKAFPHLTVLMWVKVIVLLVHLLMRVMIMFLAIFQKQTLFAHKKNQQEILPRLKNVNKNQMSLIMQMCYLGMIFLCVP